MEAPSVSIPHYERARAAHGNLPSLSQAAYIEQMRLQQQTMVEDVDRGRWAESSLCETFTGLLVQRLGRCRRFVDVGAEIGFYSYLAVKHMSRTGRILAIEPDPTRCALLRALLAAHDGVDVLEMAISDSAGTATLVKPRGCSATLAGVEGDRFQVAATSLDELLGDTDVDLVKMDIEGGEAAALIGMRRILAVQRPDIFLEYHPWIDRITPGGVETMHRLLHEADYRMYRTDEGRPRPADRLGGRVLLVPAERDHTSA